MGYEILACWLFWFRNSFAHYARNTEYLYALAMRLNEAMRASAETAI